MHVTGTIRSTRSGFAFLIRDDGEDDLLIPSDGLQGAIHGDKVRVLLFPRANDFRPLAMVEEILERPSPHFTGELVREGKAYWVRPDSPMLPERMGARLGTVAPVSGAKVLFRVENSHRRQHTAYAVLEEILGDADDARLDTLVISSEFGLPPRFPEAVLAEAEVVTAGTPWCRAAEEEDARREDFRGQVTVTIDPIDAKDFDDAIALERLGDGHRVYVHIADVTYFVREGTALDADARARGTSTYFPGAVVPVLPEAISSLAASLSPEADKRTMTAVLDLDAHGGVVATRITRGWMRSSARLHYDQVQAFLDGREEIPGEVGDLLRQMQSVARVLRKRRFAGGGFELEVPEAAFKLGADGVPVKIVRRVHEESHQIIEEFMIAANRAVGAWAKAREIPFLYRVHDEPDGNAVDEFLSTALTLKPGTRISDVRDIPSLRRWLAALPSRIRSRGSSTSSSSAP
ncbi:MAG: ribonuclease R [Candidatus Eisenbacteria bacterium]